MDLLTSWLAIPLGVVCLVIGVHQLAVFVAARSADAAGHAVMGLGMAAMFVPVADPVPQPVWVAVFVVSLAWFGAAALREGGLRGAAGHHAVGALAMLFMLLGGHAHHSAAAGPVDPGHAEHAGAAGGSTLLVTVVSLVFAAWFVTDVVRTLLQAPAAAPLSEGAVLTRTRQVSATTVGHVAMSAAMAVMLLAMA